VSHCIWWGFYAARGSGDILAYWGIEPRSEGILTQYAPAFEQMAQKLSLEVRKLRPNLAMYWGRLGGVRLEEWKDVQVCSSIEPGSCLLNLPVSRCRLPGLLRLGEPAALTRPETPGLAWPPGASLCIARST